MNKQNEETEKTPKIYAFAFLILGVSLILINYYIFIETYSIEWMANLFSSIGGSLFCLGLISCLIDMKDWREYFSARLKDIVLRQDYLNTLSEKNLSDLQTRIYKAKFKNDDIDSDGSFLNYFNLTLQPLISNPYRENVRQELNIEIKENNIFQITDKVSYTCRSNGGQIQKTASFAYSEKEINEIKRHQVIIKYPLGHEKAGKEEKIEATEKKDSITEETYKHYDLSHALVDGLIVIKESVHEVAFNQLQVWAMAHVTKNFILIARYPCNCDFQCEAFVLNPELGRKTIQNGYYNYEYESWMLPRSGIVWKLTLKDVDPAATFPCKQLPK